MNPLVKAFFDPATCTVSYVVYDRPGGSTAIIDSVLDYDPKSGRTRTTSAQVILAFVREHGLSVSWLLETHAHADHLSAAQFLRRELGGKVAIGAGITQVQKTFKGIFNLGEDFQPDARQFDHTFADGDRFDIGTLQGEVIALPGHTPACVAYKIGDAVFVGDTLFMPDVGTARCDFPGGDARQLYHSVRKLLALPPATSLFMCHDYPPSGREARWETTVADQRASNIHIRDGVTEEEFVNMRSKRDATLEMPTLILPAVQINIRAGEMPPKEANGVAYLKIPLDAL
jgi:glyoxylase-like metal-dependent hydrolase (beta-lactamase superfamily II)